MANAMKEAIEATRGEDDGIVTQSRGYVYVTMRDKADARVIHELTAVRGGWGITASSARKRHVRLFKEKR